MIDELTAGVRSDPDSALLLMDLWEVLHDYEERGPHAELPGRGSALELKRHLGATNFSGEEVLF